MAIVLGRSGLCCWFPSLEPHWARPGRLWWPL